MGGAPSWLKSYRDGWSNRGQRRPPFALTPETDQESVWDYPRPPALVRDSRRVRVLHRGVLIAETTRAWRVLETASPPTFYLPPEDIDRALLIAGSGSSFCEWKGQAAYWSVRAAGDEIVNVGWSYADPFPELAAIRDHLSFYPARLACWVDEHRAQPQPGGFYGGWVTPDVVGPFKGEPGTGGW